MELSPTIVPWLMLNRSGPTVLGHQETDDDVFDHHDHRLWQGEKLNLDIAFLKAGNTAK